MHYVGLDIGQQHHNASVVDDKGHIVGQPTDFEATGEGYRQFRAYLISSGLSDPSQGKVGMEATGPYWLSWYEKLWGAGFEVLVLNPLQVDAFRDEGIRGSKTDTLDSLLIARIIRFGVSRQSYFPSESLLGLRHLTRFRADLIQRIGDIKRQCLSVLAVVFPEYPKLFSDNFSTSALALLREAPLPGLIAKLELDRLTELLQKASRNRLGRSDARRIQSTASQSCGLTQALDAYQLHIQMLVDQLHHLENQVKVLDREINANLTHQVNEAAKEGQPPESTLAHQVERLRTIPGIGETLGPQILAEVGLVERLEGRDPPKQVVALAGIDPKVRKSGKFQGKVKMSKRGSPYLREALIQAAFAAVFKTKDPMFKAIYDRQKARGKHHWVALSHVANKMARVVYAVLRNDRTYEPILKQQLCI